MDRSTNIIDHGSTKMPRRRTTKKLALDTESSSILSDKGESYKTDLGMK